MSSNSSFHSSNFLHNAKYFIIVFTAAAKVVEKGQNIIASSQALLVSPVRITIIPVENGCGDDRSRRVGVRSIVTLLSIHVEIKTSPDGKLGPLLEDKWGFLHHSSTELTNTWRGSAMLREVKYFLYYDIWFFSKFIAEIFWIKDNSLDRKGQWHYFSPHLIYSPLPYNPEEQGSMMHLLLSTHHRNTLKKMEYARDKTITN